MELNQNTKLNAPGVKCHPTPTNIPYYAHFAINV